MNWLQDFEKNKGMNFLQSIHCYKFWKGHKFWNLAHWVTQISRTGDEAWEAAVRGLESNTKPSFFMLALVFFDTMRLIFSEFL